MAFRVALSVALVALVVVPAARALKCYQCADPEALAGITGGAVGDPFNNPLFGAAMPPCKDFDPENPESRFESDCPGFGGVPGVKPGCMKIAYGELTMRGCQPVIPEATCQKQGDVSMCYCEGDLCNGAGLVSPGLLLLAPAAVLAILRV